MFHTAEKEDDVMGLKDGELRYFRYYWAVDSTDSEFDLGEGYGTVKMFLAVEVDGDSKTLDTCTAPCGWVPSEQICRQVQEVEEVREAHKAAAKCTNGSNCGNGTKCTNLEEVQKLEISCPPPPFFFREAHAPF
jgi:hypothetical protein